MARIALPVADLRKEPRHLPQTLDHDDSRLSQLLLNEPVDILEEQGEWLRIAAPLQPRFTPKKGWHPYEGWIHNSEVSENTNPPARLIKDANDFLDVPYLWGGLSSRGIDCSGLIHLLYRARGITIPRDAHDQFLFGKKRETPQPGDPLYLAKEERVTHVVLKVDDNHFIESPETGKKVRLLRLGSDIWEEEGRWHIEGRPHPYRGCFMTMI